VSQTEAVISAITGRPWSPQWLNRNLFQPQISTTI